MSSKLGAGFEAGFIDTSMMLQQPLCMSPGPSISNIIQLDSVLVKSPAFQKTSPPCGVITWRVRRRAGPPHHREPRVLGWCPVAGPRVPIEWYSNSSLQQHGMDSMAQPPPEDTASRCPVLWQGVVTWQNLARNHHGR